MIDISVDITAPLGVVWDSWTNVDAVRYWSFATDDWGAEGIENNVEPGGTFKARNFAKDGSMEFTMVWTYDQVEPGKFLAYTMADGRKVAVTFSATDSGTRLEQSFEPEKENEEETQRRGWQGYLNNFKKYVESTTL